MSVIFLTTAGETHMAAVKQLSKKRQLVKFQKKCRPIAIQAVAISAVDPHSYVCLHWC